MLSNITNYLFGGNQNNENAEKENFNFHEVEEDDWMVIDKLGLSIFILMCNTYIFFLSTARTNLW